MYEKNIFRDEKNIFRSVYRQREGCCVVGLGIRKDFFCNGCFQMFEKTILIYMVYVERQFFMFGASEQFELLSWGVRLNGLFAVKQFYRAELLVCDAEYAYVAVLREERFHAPYVHLGVFHAGAMAHVD